jgi:hypothetical protein
MRAKPASARSLRPFFPVLAATALAAHGAAAAEGVREINQASVPSSGFPFAIASPGSYVLTSNLNVADPNRAAIAINADNVSIDLNGFEIAGPVVCTNAGPLLSCAPGGTGVGISGGGRRAVTVKNGTVRGFGGGGVVLGDYAQIDELTVLSNGARGVNVAGGARIRRTGAFRNFDLGIAVGAASVIEDCIVEDNRTGGISTGFRSVIGASTLNFNGAVGVLAASGSSVRDSAVASTIGTGIQGGNGVQVSRNAVQNNSGDGIVVGQAGNVIDNDSSFNGLAGVAAEGRSLVQRNLAVRNSGVGLYLCQTVGSAPVYRENVMSQNTAAPVSCGINGLDNICNGALCP